MNEWISVEERLPERNKNVLVWYGYFPYDADDSDVERYDYGIAYCRQFYDTWVINDFYEDRFKIYYWMPIPDPPVM